MNDEKAQRVAELALCEINEGPRYQLKVYAAKHGLASVFARCAQLQAIDYGRRFGLKYTPEEILLAAAKLARYYAEHIKEL